jgi:hypothetical protein
MRLFITKSIINSLILTTTDYVDVTMEASLYLNGQPELSKATEPPRILDCEGDSKTTFPLAPDFDILVRPYFSTNFGDAGIEYLRSLNCLGSRLAGKNLDQSILKLLNSEVKGIVDGFTPRKSFWDRRFQKIKNQSHVRYRVHRLIGIFEYLVNQQPSIGSNAEIVK